MEPESEPAFPRMKEPEPEPVTPVLHIWEPEPVAPVPKPGTRLTGSGGYPAVSGSTKMRTGTGTGPDRFRILGTGTTHTVSGSGTGGSIAIPVLKAGEDEVMQVRKGKQEGQSLPKEKPKLGVKIDREMDDTLKVEHEQFMEDLLKALQCQDNEYENDPFKVDEEQEEEKFPIHDADTH
ncbi:hypothetical protein OSB04_029035 [Centaurea solstitialis]|uniref:Uncharacterized protein n=1 Tax=Centaurea solstitialis TaxID=347529 RepID=A0AA38SIH8_9ASTR|nr:hypothetical protein OSB04_029035 [Centaurea solstitialis]